MCKQLKVIYGKSHNVNKFPYLKRLFAGKFMETCKTFQPKNSFISTLFSLFLSIPKLRIFTVLFFHNSVSIAPDKSNE